MQTILIVDDEYTITETLSDILNFEGFQSITAANGELGLRAAVEKHPDLIVLDFMMPVMDGLKMLKLLRDDERLSRIPVVLMTAAPPRALNGAEARWDALLRKPFNVDEFVGTIRTVLGKRDVA
jgi:DNA-binding response OmpR family regulator